MFINFGNEWSKQGEANKGLFNGNFSLPFSKPNLCTWTNQWQKQQEPQSVSVWEEGRNREDKLLCDKKHKRM